MRYKVQVFYCVERIIDANSPDDAVETAREGIENRPIVINEEGVCSGYNTFLLDD